MQHYYDIDITLDGRKHRGVWTLKQGGKICVGGFYGSRTVDLDGGHPLAKARELLADLVRDWLAAHAQPAPLPEPAERPMAMTVLVDGKAWHGTWCLRGRQVCVASAYSDASAPLGRSVPEVVAQRLLKQIVKQRLVQG